MFGNFLGCVPQSTTSETFWSLTKHQKKTDIRYLVTLTDHARARTWIFWMDVYVSEYIHKKYIYICLVSGNGNPIHLYHNTIVTHWILFMFWAVYTKHYLAKIKYLPSGCFSLPNWSLLFRLLLWCHKSTLSPLTLIDDWPNCTTYTPYSWVISLYNVKISEKRSKTTCCTRFFVCLLWQGDAMIYLCSCEIDTTLARPELPNNQATNGLLLASFHHCAKRICKGPDFSKTSNAVFPRSVGTDTSWNLCNQQSINYSLADLSVYRNVWRHEPTSFFQAEIGESPWSARELWTLQSVHFQDLLKGWQGVQLGVP